MELKIPKLRRGSFLPSVLEPRRRIDKALYAVIMEAYVAGVSTRSVDDLVAARGAESGISKSEVSRICAGLSTCGVRVAGAVGATTAPASSDLAVGWRYACGLRTDAAIACWDYDTEELHEAPLGSHREVSLIGQMLCAVRSDNHALCWSLPGMVLTGPPPTDFSELAAGERRAGPRPEQRLIAVLCPFLGSKAGPSPEQSADY